MCSGCHFAPIPAVDVAAHPRVHGEQAVLLPPVVAVEADELAVARDERPLLGRAHLGRDRVAQDVRDIAHARRAAEHRPVEEPGAVVPPSPGSTNRLPRCGSPCTSVRGPEFHSCTISRLRARYMSAMRWNASGSWSPRLSTAICTNFAPPPASPVPRLASHARSPSASKRGDCQYCACNAAELLDDVVRARRDVGVGRVREPAAGRLEVFEHHHVAVAVGVGVATRAARAPAPPTRGRGRSALRRRPSRPASRTRAGARRTARASRTRSPARPASPVEREPRPAGRARATVEQLGAARRRLRARRRRTRACSPRPPAGASRGG